MISILKPVFTLFLLATVLAGCARGPIYVFHKEDVTWASYSADRTNCFEQLRGDTPLDPANADISREYVRSAPASGFAGGFAEGWNRAKMETAWADECMIRKGYSAHEVSLEERRALNDLPSDEARTAYLRGLKQE